jgi:hypothetical protein
MVLSEVVQRQWLCEAPRSRLTGHIKLTAEGHGTYLTDVFRALASVGAN